MTEEPVIILCVPIRANHTPTSVPLTGDCGHRVWMAVTGQTAMAAAIAQGSSVKVMCVDCVPFESLAGEELITKPGLDELESLYGRKARRQAERAMRELGLDQ